MSRFYLSCIVLAFEHLHSLNVIYRDIKPENIMLGGDGYCKLVDFGLSKRRNETVTVCGTPEYLAPEVIQNYWHSFELDYWGFGVLCFEMVFGAPPFASYQGTHSLPHSHSHSHSLSISHCAMTDILSSKQQYPADVAVSAELRHFIDSLLAKNPFSRLGTTANGRGGIPDIMNHSWFRGKMEWNALRAHKFRPPYVPDIADDEDASHFEEVEEHEADHKMTTLFDDKSLYEWCQYF